MLRTIILLTGLVLSTWPAAGTEPVDSPAGELHVITLDEFTDPNRAQHPLSVLSAWNDGLCEIAYYRATDRLKDRERAYTRVHLFNYHWMVPRTGILADPLQEGALGVFELNIAEEIPTENFNRRYLTTVFLQRYDLALLKMVVSSQDWSGTTFKHLRHTGDGLALRSFSSFKGEGDRTWQVNEQVVPYEALLVIARDVAGTGQPRELAVLPPMRAMPQVKPEIKPAVLKPHPASDVTTAAGNYRARRVDLEWDGPLTSFVVEADPPYQLLRFRNGPARGELVHIERRAYWEPDSTSEFYKPNEAP